MTNTLNKIIHNGDEYEFPSGEVGVSSQANNIFTPGMKIWGGTQSDYQSLTPDSNTAYLLLADQPTPPSPRQPGANTVAYYPLTSTTQGTDQSGNGFNLTNGGGVSFGTYQGVDCGYFTGDNCLTTSSGAIINNGQTTFTWLSRMYFIDNGSGNPRLFSNASQMDGNFILQNDQGKIVVYSSAWDDGLTYQTGGWHLYVISGDYLAGTFTGYIDTNSASWTGSGHNYGGGLCVGGTNATTDIYNGCMSEVIYENKVRTAQEVSDYFDQTKANYGIS